MTPSGTGVGTAELSAAEVRVIQLQLLAKVAGYCQSAGIRWFLCGGTLLGAVRHKGYIPWDDDIDIMMPRDDYDEFCGQFGRAPAPGTELLDEHTDPAYPLPFAKISDTSTLMVEDYEQSCDYGVNIDVFPIDGWPTSARASIAVRSITLALRAVLALQLVVPRESRSPLKSAVLGVGKPAARLLGQQTCARLIGGIAKRFDANNTGHTGIVVWGCAERVPVSCYESAVPVDFEGSTYPAPVGWDEILTAIYGSYLTPPPADQQVTHHSYRAYRRGDGSPVTG